MERHSGGAARFFYICYLRHKRVYTHTLSGRWLVSSTFAISDTKEYIQLSGRSLVSSTFAISDTKEYIQLCGRSLVSSTFAISDTKEYIQLLADRSFFLHSLSPTQKSIYNCVADRSFFLHSLNDLRLFESEITEHPIEKRSQYSQYRKQCRPLGIRPQGQGCIIMQRRVGEHID